jgi:hypothetical protein
MDRINPYARFDIKAPLWSAFRRTRRFSRPPCDMPPNGLAHLPGGSAVLPSLEDQPQNRNQIRIRRAIARSGAAGVSPRLTLNMAVCSQVHSHHCFSVRGQNQQEHTNNQTEHLLFRQSNIA